MSVPRNVTCSLGNIDNYPVLCDKSPRRADAGRDFCHAEDGRASQLINWRTVIMCAAVVAIFLITAPNQISDHDHRILAWVSLTLDIELAGRAQVSTARVLSSFTFEVRAAMGSSTLIPGSARD